MPGRPQPFQVVVPQAFPVRAEPVQLLPGVQAGVVSVVEAQAHRVVAHRLDGADPDPLLPDLQDVLPGPWPRTSAEGEYTRRYSAVQEKLSSLSNVTCRTRAARS